MKRGSLSLFCILALLSAAVQEGAAQNGADSTQIAYRLLATWADKGYADAWRGKAIAAGVLAGSGGLMVGSAALTWFAGDAISREFSGTAMNSDLKLNLSLGLGAGGLALVGAGALVAAIPIQDPHLAWADVFEENNADLREAMAVSALRSLAQQGKERRVASFISSFLVPVLTGGIQVGLNLSQDKTWSDGLLQSLGSSSWSIAAGLTSLFSTTPEERLYQRYLIAKQAYQSSP
ncbi:MAG TPA: hypothetical protein VMV83_10250 [Rectinemataceae bacterium]|nr:hypothetical protein [Rectinemataceae bacterium]